MDKEILLLLLVLFVLFVLYISKTYCGQVEKYTDTGSNRLCDCYEEYKYFADGMCWKKNFDGQFLRNPKPVCDLRSDEKCGCWPKHIEYHGGFCYDPGHRYGIRPPCTMK